MLFQVLTRYSLQMFYHIHHTDELGRSAFAAHFSFTDAGWLTGEESVIHATSGGHMGGESVRWKERIDTVLISLEKYAQNGSNGECS